jgi:hypothetical protein
VRAAQASYARSQNICPVYLIRAFVVQASLPVNIPQAQPGKAVSQARKNFFAKRRMRVVDRAAPPNKSASQKMEENLLCGGKMAAGFGSLEFG